MIYSIYIPFCESIVQLLNPLIEIAIHDMRSDKICFIAGNLSQRNIGDPSLLDIQGEIDKTSLTQLVYSRLNYDGKLFRSISIPIGDHWLMCINFDVSVFQQMKKLSEQILMTENRSPPESLFKNDWQSRINTVIGDYINKMHWDFEHLSINQKKEIIRHLFCLGAFNEKNATDHIAKIVGLGRATVFNYLKEWKKNDN